MRTLSILMVLLLGVGMASAQVIEFSDTPHHGSMVPMSKPAMPAEIDCEDPDVPLGYWGSMHCTLHKSGAIDELIARSGTNCCSGPHSGECRATLISWDDVLGKWVAQIDGLTCPINKNVRIFYDIEFPGQVFAMACAAKRYKNSKSCPTVYCAAASVGT